MMSMRTEARAMAEDRGATIVGTSKSSRCRVRALEPWSLLILSRPMDGNPGTKQRCYFVRTVPNCWGAKQLAVGCQGSVGAQCQGSKVV